MGNVACTTENVCQQQVEERVFHQSFLSSKPVNGQSNLPSNKFLVIHAEDRPEKCIISHEDVVDALVEQAMELIRRGTDGGGESLFSRSTDGLSQSNECDDRDNDDNDTFMSQNSLLQTPTLIHNNNKTASFAKSSVAASEVTLGGRSSMYTSSEHNFSTVTAVTTDSKETCVIGNNNKARKHFRKSSPAKKHCHHQQQEQNQSTPPRLLGSGFHAKAQMHSDLQRAIRTASKQHEYDTLRLNRLVKSLEAGQGCTSLVPASLLPDPIPAYLGDHAREHMTILHLRIKPRFTDYYQSHLSRLLPDSPFTQAVSQGIALNNLSPPRSAGNHHHYSPSSRHVPTLEPTFSDSSTSTVDVVDFGEGPPSEPIKLLATGTSFADLGITGSLGLAERKVKIRNHNPDRIKPPTHYVVLLNRRSGVPLAVCALKTATTGPPVVRIYATKRRMFAQRPAANTRKLGLDWSEPYPLYPWCEIVTEGRYPNRVRYSIFMAKGNDGRFEETPSYLGEHSSVGSPEIRIVGRTDRESKLTGCAILSLCRDDGVVEEDDLFLNLSVAKGIDPALFICFAAVVDEAMEKTMRQQCQALSESIYRRS